MTPILLDQPINESMMATLEEMGPVTLWQGMDATPNLDQMVGWFVYGHMLIDGAMMDRMPNLRVISNFGVGVDHIDIKAAHERGIVVGNTPGFVDGVTADMAFLLLMAVARNLLVGDRYARSPEFLHYDPNLFHGHEVHGSTLGIVGLGAIGSQLARRARGFDMPILYHNRSRRPQAEAELGARYLSLDDLLTQADFVALTVSLHPGTYHLIGREQLRRMKSTAYLINVARGGVVDHDALTLALQEGWIAGAALDVTEPEPLPRDHPLLSMTNVVIAPHLGSATRQSRGGMFQRTLENLAAGMQGRPLPTEVG